MNLGGYDKSSFNESKGNAYLKILLESNGLLITHFSEADKVPNFDGFFEICENANRKVVPIGRINVQIKTIDKDYENKNKSDKTEYFYKYSCESKIFNAVKQGIALDPAILFLIDVQGEKIFWIHVSEQYVFEMNIGSEKHKTVYFGNENMITNIESFYNSVAKIYKDKKGLLHDKEANKFLINGVTEIEINLIIQEQWDYLNDLMDNELKFIKDHFFQDVWKFGIAYSKSETRSALGLYMIKKGENNIFIKDFNFKDSEYYFTSSFLSDKYTLNDIIRKFINDVVNNYFMKGYIRPELLPENVLAEISFEFLDTIAKCCKEYEKANYPCVYYKDEESVEKLNTLWNGLVELSFSVLDQYIANGGEMRGEYTFDPIDILQSMYFGEDASKIYFQLTQDSNTRKAGHPFSIILNGKFGYNLCLNVIKELGRRNIKTVNRGWLHVDYNHQTILNKAEREPLRFKTGYCVEDYYLNLEKLLEILPQSYSDVAKNLFNSNYDVFRIRNEYNIWYFSEKADFYYESAKASSDQFNIKINQLPYIKLNNLNWDEVRKIIPNVLQIKSGRMSSIFANRMPLYSYIRLLLYKGVCESLEFEFNSGHDIDFIL